MKWILNQHFSEEQVSFLSKALGTQGEAFPEPLARVLVQRGITTLEEAKEFFYPPKENLHSPFLMKDMRQATERIRRALMDGEKILIYGDYDVDGTTSVTLLKLFFQYWGWEVDFYIPDRYKEGYGISFKGVEEASEKGYSLIIALDCGTKSPDKVTFARQRGIDFIICDHHQTGGTHPGSVAFLNPLQEGCEYPYKELSACGIGLKLIQALQVTLEEDPILSKRHPGTDPFEEFCDLVTLSIASDLVPITGENRIIAWHGLEKIRTNPLPGIASLMRLSTQERSWDIGDLVFFIGPMINSAGRLDHARGAVDVLLGDHLEQDFVASLLEQSNARRKKEDSGITRAALDRMASDPETSSRSTTVLYQKDWHKGVIGIVASRIIEQHYKPTILLTQSEDGLWVGSGRSVIGFDLYQALDHCSAWLVQFGGHRFAAGLTLKGEHLEDFRAAFEAYGRERITPEQKAPTLEIACPLDFAYLSPKLIRILKRFSPFGPGNPEPVFMASAVEVTDVKILQEDHVRFQLRQGGISLEAIGFGLARRWKEIETDLLDVAYQPDLKTWRGVTSLQLKLKDIRKAN